MKPMFAGHPILTSLFVASLGVWALLEVRQALQRRAEATNRDQGSLLVVRLCCGAAAVLAALALNVRSANFSYNPLLMVVSLGIIWSGIALRLWCFRTLGRYFTFSVMTSADQPVITTGPYRFLRHPSYLGILLILAGIGLSYGNWLSLAALLFLPLIGFVNRIRVEEAALSSALGDAYSAYAASRRRLIPFLW